MRLRNTLGHPVGLQTFLLVPMLALVLVTTAGLGLASNLSANRQAIELVEQRGSGTLAAIASRLDEGERTKSIYAGLIAQQPEIAQYLASRDSTPLARLLLPQLVSLDIKQIGVFDAEAKPLLMLGPPVPGVDYSPLVSAGLQGLSKSAVVLGSEDLVVAAVTPIKGPTGIVGALLVANPRRDAALASLGGTGADAVELAVYRDGRLIASTVRDAAILKVVRDVRPGADGLMSVDGRLEGLHLHAVARPLGGGGVLLALVPTDDLDLARDQRGWLLAAAVILIALSMVAGTLLLRRQLARPLEQVAEVTRELVDGDYRQRLHPSLIREVDEVGRAINHLAEQLQAKVAELSYRAYHDTLSDLPNRALFVDRLRQAIARTHRSGDAQVAVLFVDLDNFKYVNDSLGHEAGDQLLVAVTERLKQCLREGDTAARLGGDEFAILIEPLEDVRDAVGVAERVHRQFRVPFVCGKHELYVSASIGIALSGVGYDDPELLMRHADMAMYRAKGNGKARTELFDSALNDYVTERLGLETELRRAIEREEFMVYYQPIVQLTTSTISEVEALVRWRHPLRGVVPPSEFIPLAEETGLIVPLGRWVLRQACQQVRDWQVRYPKHPPLVVSVNLSARQFQNPRLLEEVTEVLRTTHLDPGCLKLEITESVMMQDPDSALDTLRHLKDLGVKLAIDDFGTGYSSMAALKQCPIDLLKIDRSFIQRLGHDPQDRAIVRAIVTLAKTLNLSVTSEGIETEEQAATLVALECDYGQGFLFARPLPSDQMEIALAGKVVSVRTEFHDGAAVYTTPLGGHEPTPIPLPGTRQTNGVHH